MDTIKSNLKAGSLDTAIREFAAAHPRLFDSRGALITCVDSCPCPAQLQGWLKLLDANSIEYEILGDFVWVASLRPAVCAPGILPGFTEAYFSRVKPPAVNRITQRFTSDGADFSKEFPCDFVEQMNSIQADGYLSDGCGLNFAFSTELAKVVFEPNGALPEHR